ncbi:MULTISPECIES: NAD(P)-dependent oxidoreductase [Bacteria]|uniref:NAD(P)-dependent oxidoreductase n=1 Tax=Bacteria TaxID=2 RepID=UPI003C7A38BF
MTESPLKILAIGDSYMSAEQIAAALADRGFAVDRRTVTEAVPTWDVSGIREFEGDPAEVADLLRGYDVALVHGAPITAEVLEANPGLSMIGCLRGGPVNIDVAAAKERGVAMSITPGKNAEAVAELTIGFLISMIRNVPASLHDVEERRASGAPLAESTFEGARWFGREVSTLTLGLIGYGNVARLVSAKARALGATVIAFDPFVDPASVSDAELVSSLDELLPRIDVLSLHARATAENRHLIGEDALAALRRGALLINTARESLVDEQALLAAVRSGQVGGVAMDVNEPDGVWRELVALPQVVLTPHLGGATLETLQRGSEMIADDVVAFAEGRTRRWSL